MSNLTRAQAVARLGDIEARMTELHALRDLTDEQEHEFEDLAGEADELRDDVKRLDRDETYQRIRSAAKAVDRTPEPDGDRNRRSRTEPGAPTDDRRDQDYDRDPMADPRASEDYRSGRGNPWDMSSMRTFGRESSAVAADYHSRAIAAAERMRGASDAVRKAAVGIIERWDDQDARLSQLALASSDPAYLRGWSKLARSPHGADLSGEERAAMDRVKTVARAMSLSDANGGYLVPFQLDPTVIITANGSRNQIRQVARQVVATGDVWNGVSAGAVQWSWDGEAEEVSDDSPTLGQPQVPVRKAQGFVPISIEAEADAANITAEIGRLLAFGRDTLEAEAFVVGNGATQPTGIVTALTGTASEVNALTPETFALADVYNIDSSLPARYRANAAWLAHRGTYNRIRQFDTAGGAALWERLANDVPANLLFRPALEAEDMDGTINPAVTGQNRVLVFGDWEHYVIADRVGMTVEFIPHLFGPNRRPTGQRGWYAYYRVGADSVNDAAFRMLNVPTTA